MYAVCSKSNIVDSQTRPDQTSTVIVVNTQEAKTRLSSLLAAVDAGEVVVICRNGTPIAELRRTGLVEDPLRQNPALQGVIFHQDPTEPLQPEDWPDAFR